MGNLLPAGPALAANRLRSRPIPAVAALSGVDPMMFALAHREKGHPE